MKNNLCPELISRVKAEVKKIQEEMYCVSDVSDDMKTLVNTVFGADDYSTSGYWVRAEEFMKAHPNA